MPEITTTSPKNERAGYGGYVDWKGWNELFAFSTEDAAYFAGETSGAKIEGADVLEIGFGSGSFLAWARSKGARVVGVDIIPELIEAAHKEGIALLPPEIEGIATANAGRFDTIVAFDVFEHFTLVEIVTRLKATETMLKPGGHLILRFPNAQSPFGLAPQSGDPTHKAALSRGVYQQLLQ